ncbi:MAG: hypothetical protein AAB332_01270 [Planctomycetota bacterium]
MTIYGLFDIFPTKSKTIYGSEALPGICAFETGIFLKKEVFIE